MHYGAEGYKHGADPTALMPVLGPTALLLLLSELVLSYQCYNRLCVCLILPLGWEPSARPTFAFSVGYP